jgi:hypothetical protein
MAVKRPIVNSLFVNTGQEEEQTPLDWDGMPEYVHASGGKRDEAGVHRVVRVRFRCEEDYQLFAEKMEQPMTHKTKSIWFPQLDRFEDTLLRYVDAEIEDE